MTHCTLNIVLHILHIFHTLQAHWRLQTVNWKLQSAHYILYCIYGVFHTLHTLNISNYTLNIEHAKYGADGAVQALYTATNTACAQCTLCTVMHTLCTGTMTPKRRTLSLLRNLLNWLLCGPTTCFPIGKPKHNMSDHQANYSSLSAWASPQWTSSLTPRLSSSKWLAGGWLSQWATTLPRNLSWCSPTSCMGAPRVAPVCW